MITINAAGCGKGKSTDNKTLLTNNKTDRFLVIVPSLALANEYADYGTAITSENSENVKKSIAHAIRLNTRILIITQKAFMDYENKTLLCTHRTILQDEHLEPLYTCKWVMDNHSEWFDMFVVSPSSISEWFEVTLNLPRIAEYLLTEDMLDNKQFINDLLATPQRIITNKASIDKDSLLFRVISPGIYNGADAVHIACANFKSTRQYYLWLNMFNEHFKFTRNFELYNTPNLTIHYAEQERNSKTFNANNDYIHTNFMKYVSDNATDVVYVDNNVYTKIDGWDRVKHNCHGVNEYRNRKHIAIASAINYNNAIVGFLQDFGLMTTEQIRFSLIGEIAHQVAMRGSLRTDNNNECHIYVMETELAKYLYGCIFNNASIKSINGTARPATDSALTEQQRHKGTAIRKMQSLKLQDWPTERLMKSHYWLECSARGLYTKKYIKSLQTRLEQIENDKVSHETTNSYYSNLVLHDDVLTTTSTKVSGPFDFNIRIEDVGYHTKLAEILLK
jgi:hypothetical protein